MQSISPYDGKYDEEIVRNSAEEILAQKVIDATETAQEVEEKGAEEVGKRSRKSKSIWEKAFSRGAKVAMGSAAGMAASTMLGKKSRANPVQTGVTSAVGSVVTDLAGPIAGRFLRHLIGGLMR